MQLHVIDVVIELLTKVVVEPTFYSNNEGRTAYECKCGHVNGVILLRIIKNVTVACKPEICKQINLYLNLYL